MQIERQKHLGAAPHERTQERMGHANGYKDKILNTCLGQITVAASQGREVNGQGGGFYPQSLKRGTRSERALKLALAEMYVQGVSTRKVAAITEHLSERSVLPAPGECVIDGDQRRLAGGESLFDVQPVAAKLGCSQLLQKELDTIDFK